MTFEELAFLKSPEARQLIAENEKTAPSVFALKYRHSALATQLKYWQRSRLKLPSFYAAQAIVPPLAYEQCSSELAASAKEVSGKRCLDLTCGLGVDTHHFSMHFEKVIAIEQNEVLAEVVRYNFELMGIKNVEIRTESAENYIKNYGGEPFDLIYIDPARRDDVGKKVFLPEDCSPNIVELLPYLKKISRKIIVKMSPMYDTEAAIRQFPDIVHVQVLSIDNECKEVILTFETQLMYGDKSKGLNELLGLTEPFVFLKIKSGNTFIELDESENDCAMAMNTEGYHFIIEPDIAFYKARMVASYYGHFLKDEDVNLTASNGFFLSKNKVDVKPPARVFQILETFDYQPKKIITKLKSLNINQLNVIQRSFPFSTQQIRTALKVKEGGDFFLICTLVNDKKVAWLGQRLMP